MRKYSLILIALMLTSVGFTQLTTVNISVDKDSYIDTKKPSTNFGTDQALGVGTYEIRRIQYHKRAFVYFDLSTIPAGAEIYSAKIKLKRNGTVSGSNPWLTKRIEDSWGETTITAANQPTISNDAADVSSTYSNSNDTVIFNVSYMAKQMHRGLVDNEGWCIQVTDETSTATTGVDFYSSESSYMPILEVKYYYPLKLSNVQITHESAQNQDDAVIDLDVEKGSGSFTYEWIDGATGSVISTDTLLDSIDYGWYGLHVTGTYGEELYQAFLVGVECDSVNITFESSPEYTNHAYVNNAVVNGVDNKKKNYGNSKFFYTSHWSVQGVWTQSIGYTDFNLWMDDRFNVTKADLELQGNAHFMSNWRTNEAELIQVTSPWNEEVITYNNQPTSSNTIWVEVDSVSTTKQDRTMDISDFWDVWKTNNNANYGMKFQLQDFTSNHNVSQNYHSPNATSTSDVPVIEFTLNLIQTSNFSTVELDPNNEVGSITVDIGRICSSPTPPYYYMVSTDSIPDLADLYTYFNDSVFAGNLDSTDFYSFGDSSTSYVRSDLPYGRYYVSVFDADGDRLFDEVEQLQGEFEFDAGGNISADGTELSASQANSIGAIQIYTFEENNAEARLQITDADPGGDQFFGFMASDDSLSGIADIIYGFKILQDTLYTIEDGSVHVSTHAITDDSELRISILDDTLRLFADGSELFKEETDSTYEYKMGIGLQYDAVAFLEYGLLKKKYRFNSKVQHLTCDGQSAQIKYNARLFGDNVLNNHTVNYTITHESGTYTSNTANSLSLETLTDADWGPGGLIPGAYTFQCEIVISGGANIVFSEVVYLGYGTDWATISANYAITGDPISVEVSGSSETEYEMARSSNQMKYNEEGWIQFKVDSDVLFGRNLFRFSTMNLDQQPISGGATVLLNEEFMSFFKGSTSTINALAYSPSGLNVFYAPSADPEILLKFDTSTINYSYGEIDVYMNGQYKATIPRGNSTILSRCNSLRNNDGFKDVVSSFGCPVAENMYAHPKSKMDGYYHKMQEGLIKVVYDQEYDAADLEFNIYDVGDQLIKTEADFAAISTTHGKNYITIDVSDAECIGEGIFYLELINSKKEKTYVRFSNVNTGCTP